MGVSVDAHNDALRRIREIEKLNQALSEHVDRMRPVVDAALHWYNNGDNWSARLAHALAIYEQQLARLTRGGE